MRACLSLLLITALVLPAQSRRGEERAAKFPVRGTHGAVAAGSEFSAEAGMRLYHQGGNAVDAGIATMFAAALAEISHFGLGGEAPILIRTKQGKVYAIAGVGTMPKMATAEFFRNHTMVPGEVMQMDPGGLKGMVPVAGILPALVPGMMDAGLLALREFGTKSFGEVCLPAIELADAMPLDEMRAGSIMNSREFFELWPDTKKHFMPNGKTLGPGQVLRRPDTARTLRAMVNAEAQALKAGKDRKQAIDAVRDYFYRGEIAKKIDAFSKANNGLLRYEDMASFKLELEDLCEDYGQMATYLGGLPEAPHRFVLDDHHIFESGRPLRVCGNTAAMLENTRFADHFRVQGDRSVHYGPFDCAPTQGSAASPAPACC